MRSPYALANGPPEFQSSGGPVFSLPVSPVSSAGREPAPKSRPVGPEAMHDETGGGIGQDESTAIEKACRQWPLTLEFAIRDKHHADFVADVNGQPSGSAR